MNLWKLLFGKQASEHTERPGKEEAAMPLSPRPATSPSSGSAASFAAQPEPRPTRGKERVVRVFVSSTFRDMQAERDELVKRIFPQLRKLCADRGVTFTEVDLRWGLTEEDVAEGQVLPLCLAEIERCRPFFIGLLGERYGWVPPSFSEELIQLQPWLVAQGQKSVTELEILHGVLNDPSMASQARFYFRDPAYLDHIPANDRGEYRELDPKRAARLKALKTRIRKERFSLRENFPDPVALGRWVLEDLSLAIDQMFPGSEPPDPLDRDAADHEAFARSRTRTYIGRKEYFDALDQHAGGDGPPLIVLGDSGAGKSALLANWALQYRESHSDEMVLTHFIGATRDSADWSAMVCRILGELKRRLRIAEEIPKDPDALRTVFANWLHLASARCDSVAAPHVSAGEEAGAKRELPHNDLMPTKIVLVLDALNQLDNRDGAPDLVWLPPVIPANVRLVLSTLPGRPLTELKKRSWPTLFVHPLQPDERRRLIAGCLAEFARKLSPARVNRIASAQPAANPLYLRALLDELRVFGDYERLDERIDYYLAASSVPSLYNRILERWEADYERDRSGLVREAMTAIWASRRGMAESELLELLTSNGQPLPRAVWSPLFLAAERSLLARSGLLGFSHEYFRVAVECRYLPDADAQRAARIRLAHYFERQPISVRRIEELPWQLLMADDWPYLASVLRDTHFLAEAYKARAFEVEQYWNAIQNNSTIRIVESYQDAITTPENYRHCSYELGNLLDDLGYHTEALPLLEKAVEHCKDSGNPARHIDALLCLGVALEKVKGPGAGMPMYETALSLAERTRHDSRAALSLANIGIAMAKSDHSDRAREILARAEKNLLSCHAPWFWVCQVRLRQVELLMRRWDLDAASQILSEAMQAAKLSGCSSIRGELVSWEAELHRRRGDLEGALNLVEDAGRFFRSIGDRLCAANALVSRGVILKDMKRFDLAYTVQEEARDLYKALGNDVGIAQAQGNQAELLILCQSFAKAREINTPTIDIFRCLNRRMDLAVSLVNQSIILKRLGESEAALMSAREAREIYEALGDPEGEAKCMINEAAILVDSHRVIEAKALIEEARELATKHKLDHFLWNCSELAKRV